MNKNMLEDRKTWNNKMRAKTDSELSPASMDSINYNYSYHVDQNGHIDIYYRFMWFYVHVYACTDEINWDRSLIGNWFVPKITANFEQMLMLKLDKVIRMLENKILCHTAHTRI